MAERHKYVAFYMDKWVAGTSRMSRVVKSVFFDICLANWDKAEGVDDDEIDMITQDMPPGQGAQIVAMLLRQKKLVRNSETGLIYSPTAIEEATKAYDLWAAKSKGGRNSVGKSAAKSPAATPGTDKIREDQKRKKEGGPRKRGPVGEPKKSRPTRDDCQPIADAWNAMASKIGLSQVLTITPSRFEKLRCRIETYGVDRIFEAIALVPERAFLTGAGSNGWKANFDWFVKPNSVTQIIEDAFAAEEGGKASGWRP